MTESGFDREAAPRMLQRIPVPPTAPHLRLPLTLVACFASVASLSADPNVAVTAKAKADYTARKFGEGKAAPETYVFMVGQYFEGATVDHSLERMPFRRIAEYLGVELARRNYLPAPSAKEAQLLLVVDWGATTPRVSHQDSFGQNNFDQARPSTTDIVNEARRNPTGEAMMDAPGTDNIPDPNNTSDPRSLTIEAGAMPHSMSTPDSNDMPGVSDRLIGTVREGNAVQLLGYQDIVHRLGKRAYADELNDIINFHLTHERYFITVSAYDVQGLRSEGRRRRPEWTLHLNISSPGNNFATAMQHISVAAADYAGRSTDGLQTVRPKSREGTVKLAPLIILGEVNTGSK